MFVMLSDVLDEDICLRKASEFQWLVVVKGFSNAHANKNAPKNGADVKQNALCL